MANTFNRKPRLFSAAIIRQVQNPAGSISDKNFDDVVGSSTNVGSTSSFRYDVPGVGIKSSQQVNTDFSKFENHSFFTPARINVNVAFDKIINEFPFDGTGQEYEEFLDELTGFESYVLGSFPKSKGFLFFSGASGPAPAIDGTHVSVKDFAGFLYPDLSKNDSGDNVIDPGTKSFSIEAQLLIASEVNDNQVICQKIAGTSYGITLGLSASASTTDAGIIFGVSSGSISAYASASLEKGKFNHICATLNRDENVNRLEFYVDDELVASSSTNIIVGDFGFATSPFNIASGTIHKHIDPDPLTTYFTPVQTFSGAIDELRVFHDVRHRYQLRDFATKNIFAEDALKLYLKFNEPPGTYSSNDVALDSSGNSLHTEITNFSNSLRVSGVLNNPMPNELLSRNPVLFPSFEALATLNALLLTSASNYDNLNPNMITRLIPSHYFIEGMASQGFTSEIGPVADDFTGPSIPGSGDLGTAQVLSAFLYTIGKYFDELKIMTDAFSTLDYVDYNKENNVPDQFITQMAKRLGIDMPTLFSNASFKQFFDGDDLLVSPSITRYSLNYVQNEIWRRILINFQDIIQSKGTLHAVKSIIRATGINPDSNFRIREFGGPTKRTLKVQRVNRTEVSSLISFTGSLAPVTPILNAQGIPDNKPFLMSSYLSGSRLETGYPGIGHLSTMVDKLHQPVHGISNEPNDGLYTSGSFTYEGVYAFPRLLSGSYPQSQSLVRLNTTGSTTPALTQCTFANLVLISGDNPKIKFFTRSNSLAGALATGPLLQLELTGADVFDGNAWHISFGRFRNDDPNSPNLSQQGISSSYFLRASRQNFGKIKEMYTTSSFFKEVFVSWPNISLLKRKLSTYNASGAFMVIGSQSLTPYTGAPGIGLNDSSPGSVPTDTARTTNFAGRVGHIRFWSKALQEDEWREHVRNFKSLGVNFPLKNFNFTTQPTGSFQRLRMDVTADQPVTQSTSLGTITLTDFSQARVSGTVAAPWRTDSDGDDISATYLYMSGTGFQADNDVIKPQTFNFSMISPHFDETVTSEKVRPRSFQDPARLSEYPYAQIAPVYRIPKSEEPDDDLRFSIDFSITDTLDEDIVLIFATLESLDDVLGDPNLLFSPDYPDLEDLREVYFNRLTNKINLKGFFEFFKWFDTTIGTIIEQLIPRKTNYLGTNFVVESHMLERPKIQYHYADFYLGDFNRSDLKGTIRLMQLVGQLRKM